ncbi:hypothetical protein ASD53_18815 [Lysobacter sp. Root559]|nr:hypothetical protein ASD53_18815 [Lysobacter sp. Root559]KRC36473.1 hypothetical protein ASE10_04940 [Lysobacter sp. Root76]KRD64803.1 hypothetical protein ASE45_19390 [Lysobacter sp. Root96]
METQAGRLSMDPAWDEFSAICRQDFVGCEFQEALLKVCDGNEDIAWAVYFHCRGDAIAWTRRSVPALGGKTPASLIEAGRGDEVRACLWSMPC